jgi:outer membrane biosynthesis protein TonB
MSEQFESRKNLRATGYTTVVCAVLLILLIGLSWTRPAEPQPVVEEGIEVNLGNSDQGLGKNQPYLPGDPSPQDKEKYTPPKQAVVEKVPVKDVETDDNQKDDEPVVKKAVVTKPDATKIPDKEVTKAKVRPVKVPETLPEKPKPEPHPKAVFRGVNGTGKGGNNADDYKQGGNEGIAGGHGDQGAPGGNPSSTNYVGGGHGNGGIVAMGSLKGRAVLRWPSFTDDFNHNGVVMLTVHVDEGGNVVDAEYRMYGSTITDREQIDIAIRKIKQMKFAAGDDATAPIQVNFKLHQ